MAKKSQSPPRNFEEALTELEKILSEIESGEIGLEESIAKYERGQFLIQHCRNVLGKAEKQIESLNKEALPESTTQRRKSFQETRVEKGLIRDGEGAGNRIGSGSGARAS